MSSSGSPVAIESFINKIDAFERECFDKHIRFDGGKFRYVAGSLYCDKTPSVYMVNYTKAKADNFLRELFGLLPDHGQLDPQQIVSMLVQLAKKMMSVRSDIYSKPDVDSRREGDGTYDYVPVWPQDRIDSHKRLFLWGEKFKHVVEQSEFFRFLAKRLVELPRDVTEGVMTKDQKDMIKSFVGPLMSHKQFKSALNEQICLVVTESGIGNRMAGSLMGYQRETRCSSSGMWSKQSAQHSGSGVAEETKEELQADAGDYGVELQQINSKPST